MVEKLRFLANICFDFGNFFKNLLCIYFNLNHKFCKTFYKFGPVDFALGLGKKHTFRQKYFKTTISRYSDLKTDISTENSTFIFLRSQ